MQEDRQASYFTPSIIVNFLILVALAFPGTVAYAIAKQLAGDLWYTLFPIAIGLIVLLGTFLLTIKIIDKIRAIPSEGD